MAVLFHGTVKWEIQDSHVPLTPHMYSLPLLSGSPTTIITTNEPLLTHRYRSESIVNIRVHSWCCTRYAFGQIYSDIYVIYVKYMPPPIITVSDGIISLS